MVEGGKCPTACKKGGEYLGREISAECVQGEYIQRGMSLDPVLVVAHFCRVECVVAGVSATPGVQTVRKDRTAFGHLVDVAGEEVRRRPVEHGGIGRHQGGEPAVRRQSSAVEPVQQELSDGGQDEAEKHGDGRPQRVAPVHQVVGVRAAVRTASVVDEVEDVEDGVDETSQQRVDHVVDADRDGIGEHVDDDVDRVQRMF